MAEQLKPKSIRNLGINGVIRPSEVDDSLIPDGAVTEAKNFEFDQIGASTSRPGLTTLGSSVSAGYGCVGMHNALSNTAVAVFSQAGSSAIYVFDKSTTWGTGLTGGAKSATIRFVDFGSYSIVVNFSGSMRVWSGGAETSSYWFTSGHSINPHNLWEQPVNPQYGEVYKSRVYLFGDTANAGDPSRLYFSSVIDSQGSITFSPTVDYVDINPGDGEDGTGLKRYSLELLCFKPNYIYRFRTSGTDPDPLIKIGTRSNESIVEGKRGLYFHHDSGFYRYTGGYPEEISSPINDFIEAIPYSQYSSIVGWNDNNHIYWSVGNLSIAETKETTTWKNVVLRYTESSDVWTVYSYSNDIRSAITYNNGTSISRIVGTDHGVVATQNSGTSDFGEPIYYTLRTKWYEFDGLTFSKVINDLVAISEKSQAMTLMYQVDDDSTRWQTLGQITDFRTEFNNNDIRFNRIRFKVTGSSVYESPVFRGLEIIRGIFEGVIKNGR
ncbi:hypothetical protein M0R04_10690 [Candidatus Dojkabacteria bacterium]|jgi:hypothetical protein|nr:hypothetical protein [Candidatus Dojkabacteria bacterium]